MKLDLTRTQLAQRISAKQKGISRYEISASFPSIEDIGQNCQDFEKPLVISWMNEVKKPKKTNSHMWDLEYYVRLEVYTPIK